MIKSKIAYLHAEELMLYKRLWGTSKSGGAIRILGVAPTVGEKGVVLKVGEISASHPNPLHAHRLVHWDKAGSLYKQK